MPCECSGECGVAGSAAFSLLGVGGMDAGGLWGEEWVEDPGDP